MKDKGGESPWIFSVSLKIKELTPWIRLFTSRLRYGAAGTIPMSGNSTGIRCTGETVIL